MISLIIPVYNEVENILPLVKKIKNSLKKYKYEVIFINDGSYDDTEIILKKIIKENNNFPALTLKEIMAKLLHYKLGLIIPLEKL